MIDVRYRRGAALAAVLLTSVSAPALALAQSTHNLGTMVVSANLVETDISQVGSSVSVVTAEDLEKKQAVTLEDALQEVPGLQVYSNGNAQFRQRMTMRGQDMQHIVFIVDGVKIENQASSMYSNPYSHLSASDIERIEVLRGNQSALYGSDAIGGVILITTKSGKNSQKMVEGEASAEAGSFQTRKASATVSGRIDEVYYKVAGSRFQTEGFDITKNVGRKEADGSDNSNLNLKMGADVLKNVGVLDLLNLEGNYHKDQGVSESDTSGTDSDSYYRTETETMRFQTTADMFDGLLSNMFAVNRMDSYVYVGTRGHKGNTVPSRYFGDTVKYEYRGTLRPVEDHTFVFGAEQERDHYRNLGSTTANNRTVARVNSSAFGNWGMAFLDKALNFNLGTRQEFHDVYGQHNTYRGTASYSVRSTGTRPHASYGTGYKAPMLVMLYGNSGTPTLKPEETRGFDVGVEQLLLGDRLRLDVTAFKTDMTNAISLGRDTSSKYRNIGSTRSMGLENTANFEVSREWGLSATHTYTEARDNDNGGQVEYIPKHVGTLRVDYAPDEVPGLRTWTRMSAATGSTQQNYSGGAPSSRPGIGGYSTWDVGADYAVDEMISVYGRVLNLLDKGYGQMPGYTKAGINGYAGVKVKF